MHISKGQECLDPVLGRDVEVKGEQKNTHTDFLLQLFILAIREDVCLERRKEEKEEIRHVFRSFSGLKQVSPSPIYDSTLQCV